MSSPILPLSFDSEKSGNVPPSNRKIWILVGVLILVFIGLGVGLYFALRKKPATSTASTTSTTSTTPPQAAAVQYPLRNLSNDSDSGVSVSASSVHNPPDGSPYKAFDSDSTGSSWQSVVGAYDSATGNYSLNAVETLVGGQSIKGDWIQIALPYPTQIRPTEMTLVPREGFGTDRMPRNFVVVGSNDSVSWTKLLDKLSASSAVTDYTASGAKTFAFPSSVTGSYRYFRLIVTAVGNKTSGGSRQDCVNLSDWRIQGLPTPGSQTTAGTPSLSTGVEKTEQISTTACNPSSEKLARPLTAAQIDDATYSYGRVAYDSGVDGVFVKGGCRGKFKLQPSGDEVYCSSFDWGDRLELKSLLMTAGRQNNLLTIGTKYVHGLSPGSLVQIKEDSNALGINNDKLTSVLAVPNPWSFVIYSSGANSSSTSVNGSVFVGVGESAKEAEYCRPKGEAFSVSRPAQFSRQEAEDVCRLYNADLASTRQLRTAVQQKGTWCKGGWVKDNSYWVYNPYITDAKDKAGQSCGNTPNKIFYDFLGGGLDVIEPVNGKAAVNCYGVRPPKAVGDHQILDFSGTKKSMYS